jgi:excisionase family DNA binding protein
LTIEEGAQYFGIGENKMRRIAEENEDSDYILSNGNRRLIKRKRFEQYLDHCQMV